MGRGGVWMSSNVMECDGIVPLPLVGGQAGRVERYTSCGQRLNGAASHKGGRGFYCLQTLLLLLSLPPSLS